MDPPQQTCQSKNRYHEVVRKDAVLYVCMYVCMYVFFILIWHVIALYNNIQSN